MDQRILQLCRSYLERAYRERLGYELKTETGGQVSSQTPTWRTVSSSDFTTIVSPLSEAAGLLLDPELGILLYLVPFLDGTQVSVHVNRALRIRSQLSVERNYSASPAPDSDPNGAWRVAMCWLVPITSGKTRWLDQVTELRKGTMFSEEVSLDVVFLESTTDLKALEEHTFPCLMLTTRQIFKKEKMSDVTHWLRADGAVRTALKDFVSDFDSPDEQALASEVLSELNRKVDSASTSALPAIPAAPIELKSIRIQNFRNLGDVSLDFGSEKVRASIIHGPNGTGKSSVCEALSIALFGSSYRFNHFGDGEREKDLTTTNRAAEYVSQYLTSIDADNVVKVNEPRLALNGITPEAVHLLGREKLFESEMAMSGTILTQDTSLEFARMQADQLGARVLRNYSEVAERLENFTEEKYLRANSARQEYLRTLNISASITLIDTAYSRIAAREISRLISPSLDSHVTWLLRLEESQWKSTPLGLATQWSDWRGEVKRSALAEAMSKNRNVIPIRRDLGRWLDSYNKLVERSAELARLITSNVTQHSETLGDAEAKMRILIEWRSKRAQAPVPMQSTEVDELRSKLAEMQKRQQKIIDSGIDSRTRLEHLAQAEAFVKQTWSKLHPDECPTCGVDHSKDGGVLKVILVLKGKATVERDKLRESFSVIKAEIETAQKTLSSLGQSQSPLSAQEQSSLVTALQWLLPEGITLDECLDNETARNGLIGLLACVRAIPPLPQAMNVDEQTERIAQSVLGQYKEAEAIFRAPDNWKPVRAKVTETLARVLREHLPSTLAGLWVELSLNLTAAAWLLPGRPLIDVATRRGDKKSTLRVKGRLVRYVLNQSEVHVLGLAWFFTRYLTHGRFHHACLIIDDPAQEMDQTTFRELCRMLETLCRLHRVYGRPLKLVVLMNQENRALDIARATGGVTHLLGWVPEQKNSVTVLNVVTPGFFAPLPTRLFATGTVG